MKWEIALRICENTDTKYGVPISSVFINDWQNILAIIVATFDVLAYLARRKAARVTDTDGFPRHKNCRT
jgi:hypothetical protein